MGLYYGIGVAIYFNAYSGKVLSQGEWEDILTKRLDLELYDVTIEDKSINGILKEGVFQDNIEDLYKILKDITNNNQINYYFKQYGII